MIHFDNHKEEVEITGDMPLLMSELLGVMYCIYKKKTIELGEDLVLPMFVSAIRDTIRHLGIPSSKIISAIQSLEEVEDVHG